MRSRRTAVLLPILLLCVFFTTACPNRTNIAKINADPGRYLNKEVGVAGTVTESYGLLNLGGAYEVDDGTGRIWVVTRRGGAPSRGARVGVKGRVYNGLTFGGRSYGTVLEEAERRNR